MILCKKNWFLLITPEGQGFLLPKGQCCSGNTTLCRNDYKYFETFFVVLFVRAFQRKGP